MAVSSATRLPEQFEDYEKFRDWLFESFPEDATSTTKGSTFRDFVMSLLPETARGRCFGQLKPATKQSHDRGVDVISADSGGPLLALQAKLTIREKGDIDDIISKFHAYEVDVFEPPQMSLEPGENGEPPRPVFAIATSSRISGIISAYEASQLTSRAHYQRLKNERRLLIWNGDDLLGDAQQVISRRYEIPLRVELSSVVGWRRSGSVLVGVVKGADLVALEERHGPGLFFENVRGWKGLEPVRDDETVNEAIKKTIVEAPGEMLARNNGVTFRAAHIEEDDGRVVLHSASIVNGRQTTGCLTDVRELSPACEVFVKVVEAEGDAWPIATAANNQNTVARIDLRLARYFREQLIQRELAPAGGSSDWLRVIEGLRTREADFDHLRYLFIGLFCRRPNQLADDNYSHIRFDILDSFFEGGEPPATLYPTLYNVVTATNAALAQVEGLGDSDPFAKIHSDHRPKYRAYLGILALCGTHQLDLAQQLINLDEEIERIQEWLDRTTQLLASNRRLFERNFSLAYEVAGMHALDAYDNGSDLKIQQQLSNSVFHTGFPKLYRQLIYRLQLEDRRHRGEQPPS